MGSTKEQNARYFQRLSPAKREQRRIKERAWRKANPDKARAHNRWSRIKHRYGLSKAEWLALFFAQENCCAACRSPIPKSKRGWVTDHSHFSNKVRGILCLQCNVILGMAKDDPSHLRNLAQYLEENERA
jgi:hypothetical protein